MVTIPTERTGKLEHLRSPEYQGNMKTGKKNHDRCVTKNEDPKRRGGGKKKKLTRPKSERSPHIGIGGWEGVRDKKTWSPFRKNETWYTIHEKQETKEARTPF